MTTVRRIAIAAMAAAVVGCTDRVPVGPESARSAVDPDGFTATVWDSAHVRKMALTVDNTLPLYVPPEDIVAPDLWIWDSWPVRTRDGQIAKLNGQYIMVALTAPDSVEPSKRTPQSQLRYFLSENGTDWHLGGLLFGNSQPEGRAQWAGSTMYDETSGNLYAFYTAISGTPVPELEGTERTIQKLALGVARVTGATDSALTFGTWKHDIIAEPEGRYYELPENADTIGVVYAFRDPFFYRDPANGQEYVLFTGNAAGLDTSSGLNRSFNSVVGIIEAQTSALTQWTKLPPLFTGFGVNRQMERPHIINTNGLYYVFWLSHSFTFSEGFTGYEGLYGYAGPSLFGQKEPLNGSSLVVGNPAVVASQSYSFFALPAGEGAAKIISFLNIVGDVTYVTFAPAVGLSLDGLNTRISSANAGPKFSRWGVDTRAATVLPITPGPGE